MFSLNVAVALISYFVYDYKIEHQEGSVLKVFLTGETLSVSARNNLLETAKEYGISEEQIIIKEYITKNAQDNEQIFKGIYEKLDSEIEMYEATIDQLTNELQTLKKDELPYLQIASEIAATYPEVRNVCMGKGASVALDSMKVTPATVVKIQTDSTFSESAATQLKRWLQVRLQDDNLLVDIE